LISLNKNISKKNCIKTFFYEFVYTHVLKILWKLKNAFVIDVTNNKITILFSLWQGDHSLQNVLCTCSGSRISLHNFVVITRNSDNILFMFIMTISWYIKITQVSLCFIRLPLHIPDILSKMVSLLLAIFVLLHIFLSSDGQLEMYLLL
jgi:hypothetical protein